MLVGGAIVNAVAFSGSNYLFSMLRDTQRVDEERKRHDKAIEQLQSAQEKWARQRAARLDWINEELRRQNHSLHTFEDIDSAIREYSLVTGKTVSPMQPEPQLSDFYTPSRDQKDREIAFILLGLGVTGLVAYKLKKNF